jgi:hypothetical protein
VHVHSAKGKHLARENRRTQYDFRPGARAAPSHRKKHSGEFLNKVTTLNAGADLAAIENDTGIVGEQISEAFAIESSDGTDIEPITPKIEDPWLTVAPYGKFLNTVILLLQLQGVFKIVQAFHSNYFGPRFSGSGGQVYVEDAVALLDEDKHRPHGYFFPLSGWTGCFPGEAISHLLNERENDVEPIVVIHEPADQSVGEKETDPIRSTSFRRSRALAAYFAGPHRLSVAFIISKIPTMVCDLRHNRPGGLLPNRPS